MTYVTGLSLAQCKLNLVFKYRRINKQAQYPKFQRLRLILRLNNTKQLTKTSNIIKTLKHETSQLLRNITSYHHKVNFFKDKSNGRHQAEGKIQTHKTSPSSIIDQTYKKSQLYNQVILSIVRKLKHQCSYCKVNFFEYKSVDRKGKKKQTKKSP